MKVVTLVFLLASCGAEPAAENAPATEREAKPDAAEPQPVVQSLALERRADLPGCGKGNNHQLVYVREEAVFLACEEGSWAEVEIRGERGSDGTAGTNGSDGKDGRDGTDGLAGANGSDGAAGATGAAGTAAFSWDDPVTGKRWVIRGWGTNGAPDFRCYNSGYTTTSQFDFPTEAKVREAITNGLLDSGGPNEIWTSDGGTVSWVDASDTTAVTLHAADPKELHGIYCVER